MLETSPYCDHTAKPVSTKVCSKSVKMLVQFETPASFTLFKVLNEGKLSEVRDLSLDFSTANAARKLLSDKSAWSNQKFVANSDLSVVAVLICGHTFHEECLETMTAESDALVMKQKIRAGLKSEEIHSQQHNESFSSLDHLEAELQQLNSRNHDLTQEIVKLGTLSGEPCTIVNTGSLATDIEVGYESQFRGSKALCNGYSEKLDSTGSYGLLHDESNGHHIGRLISKIINIGNDVVTIDKGEVLADGVMLGTFLSYVKNIYETTGTYPRTDIWTVQWSWPEFAAYCVEKRRCTF
ncbi:hypothetical protein KIW84_051371 [Lathyrus oleraceus]|uniref:Uncharacterized protein n=1 Tax=Pisum sativum TaxID=3888 RepID=A0A9D4WKZ5_PEA|nr:hypothetical protein KIW84_051371 [Pisum sativum]